MSAGCSGERPATTPAAPRTVAVATTSTSTSTTTVAKPTVRLVGLPEASDAKSDPQAIMVMQRLLTATCCTRKIDGIWGPMTDGSIQLLRESVGLPPGGLDRDLWSSVFTEIDFGEPIQKSGIPFPISIPSNAVQLHSADEARNGWWTIAANTNLAEVVRWFEPVTYKQALGAWRWCDEEFGESSRSYRWWTGDQSSEFGAVFELEIADLRLGRVDLRTSEVQRSITGCLGYVPTTPVTTAVRTTVTPQAPALLPALPQPTVPSVQRYRVGAICRDGSRSSATGRGACSWHGGVAYWLYSS